MMKMMRKSNLFFWAAFGCPGAANLQPQDLFFISAHRFPTQVVSDDKLAYVITEGGVLAYDYRRSRWMDNLAPGAGIKDISFQPDKNRLLMLAANGGVLEYNSVFRRVSQSSEAFTPNLVPGTSYGELNGLYLGSDYTCLGEEVRDRWNRRVPVTAAKVFDYDHLWLLTAGHGVFLGSQRRKEAPSLWFGLYSPSVLSLYSEGKEIWFGSADPAGALVRSSQDLSEWKIYASRQDYEFPNGTIRDMVRWRDFLWMATDKGVVRQEVGGRLRLYRKMLGASDLPVHRLYVHQDRLFAGTEKGAAFLEAPEAEFRAMELPVGIQPLVRDFWTKGPDLWAATQYGLFVRRKDGWKSLKDVTPQDVPEGHGVNVYSVGYRDSTLYFSDDDCIFEKPRGRQPKTLFDATRIFRIAFDGDILYAGFEQGVRAFNVKTRLWVDFRLEDGIPGTKVQAFMIRDGVLWMGTDRGVMRIRLKPYLP